MEFGSFMEFHTRGNTTQAEAFAESFGHVKQAEQLGLDGVWLAESHFNPQRAVLSSPMVIATGIAARTKRMKIGTAVQVLPLTNPLRMAEEAATLDHISEGRFEFGASNIVGGDLRANTNAVAFKTASSDSTTTLFTGNVYLYGSGSDSGCILDNDSTSSGAEACGLTGGAFWQYKPVLYVIRNDTVDGNIVPVLCRLQLKTAQDTAARSASDALTLNPATDCLAEGIEQIHLEFGLDTDEDLVANQYISDISTDNSTPATDMELAVSIRIYLLVRSATADWSYTNSKTYNMGSMTIAAFNDNYYRRVYSTTVMLRNPTAFIGLL